MQILLILLQALLSKALTIQFQSQPSTVSFKQVAIGAVLTAFSIQINDGGSIDTTATDLVTIGLVGGDGLMGTITKNAVSGVATFDDIQVFKLCSNCRIVAQGITLDPVLSNQFDITTAGLGGLRFQLQPTNVEVNENFSIQVVVTDGFGNDLSLNSQQVDIEILGGNLQGVLSQSTVSGIATFSSISVAVQGLYTIKATANGFEEFSQSFQVSKNLISVQADEDIYVGELFIVDVKLVDYDGSNITSSETVEITVQSGPGTLLNGNAQSKTDGSFTFDSLIATQEGTYVFLVSCTTCMNSSFTLSRQVEQQNQGLVKIQTGQSYIDKEVSTALTYNIVLNRQPIFDVVVDISSLDTALGTVDISSATFTTGNWNTPQTITITIQSVPLAQQLLKISHSAQYQNALASSILIQFDGYDDLIVSQNGLTTFQVIDTSLNNNNYVIIEGNLILEEGQSGTYTIKLSSSPSDTVFISPDSSILTFSPTTIQLNQSNYNAGATIKATALSGIAKGQAYTTTITHDLSTLDVNYSSPKFNPTQYQAIILPSGQISILLSGDVAIQEGQTASYYIVLTSMPTDNVTVNLTITNTDYIEITSPESTIIFTPSNYYKEQRIELSVKTGSITRGGIYQTTITHAVVSADTDFTNAALLPSDTINVTILNPCTNGFYSWPPGSGSCYKCPLGKSCVNPYDEPIDCTAGTYSPLGERYCIPCPPGTICSGSGLPEFCPIATFVDSNQCTACTGQCWLWGNIEQDCPTTTYQTQNGRMCHTCPAGFQCDGTTITECILGQYSTQGDSQCNECPEGYYCPDPSYPFPIPCPPGYQSSTGSSICQACPEGESCSAVKQGSATNCSANEYSPAGTGPCMSCNTNCSNFYDLCPNGQLWDGSACQDCGEGKFCNSYTAGNCPPGYFQDSATEIICKRCPTGYYNTQYAQNVCVQALAGQMVFGITKIDCPPGTYSNDGSYACLPCNDKLYCPDSSQNTEDCPAGSICSNLPLFSTINERQVPCPYGYTCAQGISLYSEAVACQAGKACNKSTQYDSGQSLDTQQNCMPGHFCPQYTSFATQFKCPAGTFSSATDNDQQTDCQVCTAGNYCPESSVSELTCPLGHFCPSGISFPIPCDSGSQHASTGQDQQSDCQTCTQGYFCPQGTFDEIQCRFGSYGNSQNLQHYTDCTLCDQGNYCNQPALTNNAGQCPQGYYCPKGTSHPYEFPCPAGTNNSYTTTPLNSISDCPLCEEGYFCTIGTGDNTKPKVPCYQGNACISGTKWSHQYRCSNGTFQDSEQQTSCQDCPSGAWCYPGSYYKNQMCSPGHFCTGNNELPDSEACASGSYTRSGYLKSQSECSQCPQGSFCPEASYQPVICPKGYYSSNSAGLCTICSAGKYCPEGATAETPCPAGTYSDDRLFKCLDCPYGFYCPGNTDDGTACQNGTYCPKGSISEQACPDGFKCVAGIAIACEPGQLPSSDNTTCEDVPAGSYSLEQSELVQGQCNPGYYCQQGSKGPYDIPCPRGTFRIAQNGSAQGDCIACPAGYYCPTGTDIPIICDVGSYCPGNNSLPTPCPAGSIGRTYGLAALEDCELCPVGRICMETGSIAPLGFCAQGYECKEGSTTSVPSDGVCTPGGYCEQGLSTKRSCPPGSFNNRSGAKDSSYCTPCPEGHFCEGDEEDILDDTNPCLAGYYCPQGSWWNKQVKAPPGTYTDTKAFEATNCPVTKFNPIYGQSECQLCPAGYICPDLGMEYPQRCQAGQYCEAGQENPSNCLEGTFMPKEGWSDSACYQCEPGQYCNQTGLQKPNGPCDPGFWCLVSASTKNPSDSEAYDYMGQCPGGHYCPSGTPIPIPCPAGTNHDKVQQSDLNSCINCEEGYFCDEWGQTTHDNNDLCSAGYYCRYGERVSKPNKESDLEPKHCIAGQKCPEGSAEAQSCPPGTYQYHSYQSDCDDCPAGFFCSGGTSDYTQNPCPAGYYCPLGTQYATQYPCPTGKYYPNQGAKAPEDCMQCPPGMYCDSPGLNSPRGLCSEGFYCSLGSQFKDPSGTESYGGPCGIGKYCPEGSSAEKVCDGGKYCGSGQLAEPSGNCEAGYYCVSGAITSRPTDGTTGNICPSGHYCPQGSISPIPCPPGKFTTSTNNIEQEDCIDCPGGYYCSSPTSLGMSNFGFECDEGYYCDGGDRVSRPYKQCADPDNCPDNKICPKGHYCPSGSSNKRQCLPGYYQDQTKQVQCKECPQGYYCENSATENPIICPVGKYCPAGSINPRLCPAGTYNRIQGRTKSSDCINCPPGYYCEDEANENPDGQCQQGYFCIGSAQSKNPSIASQGGACPRGYICAQGATEPIECPPGYFCPNESQFQATNQCLEGYYCLGGAYQQSPRDGITGNICPQGHYCPTGSINPTPCPIGTYSNASGNTSEDQCIKCNSGYYCKDLGATSVTNACSEGYYCVNEDTDQNPVLNKIDKPIEYPCKAGNFCPKGTIEEKKCPEGRYQPKIGQSSCLICPQGRYCNQQSTAPTNCEAGYRCTQGTARSSQIPCELGEYQPYEGQSDCLAVPAGQYTERFASTPITTTIECPQYAYCGGGTSSPPPLCPQGTFNTNVQLQDFEQCYQCPGGKYCQNGQVIGDCTAGYLCESGVNTDRPDGYSNTGIGSPCPIGHYCPYPDDVLQIPNPCPNGKVFGGTGADEESDCVDCPQGFYCLQNDPVPKICPPGSYCPAGSNKPQPCPQGQYQPKYAQYESSSCINCPSGYNCFDQGISEYRNYPCSTGHYCERTEDGQFNFVVSPEGKYSPGHQAGNVDDLKECPAGNKCVEGSIGYEPCPIGTYCNEGVAAESECPAGSFCPYSIGAPIPCNAGWYCPLYSSLIPQTKEIPSDDVDGEPTIVEYYDYPPFKCPEGTVCPQGSSYPIDCTPGFYAVKARSIMDVPSCDACAQGTYSNEENTICLACTAGYVCLGETKQPNPVDEEIDRGFECIEGFYCPEGSYELVPCPVGTYNPNVLQSSEDACLPCEAGFFNALEGQKECLECGEWAISSQESVSCTCIGNNRTYLKDPKECRCDSGFEYLDTDGDDLSNVSSDTDCDRKVYDRCTQNQVRDEFGECVDNDYRCDDICSKQNAIEAEDQIQDREPATGLCLCSNVQEAGAICPLACRQLRTQMCLQGNGKVLITDPVAGTEQYVQLADILGVHTSEAQCYTEGCCEIVSVAFNDSGVFGIYGTFDNIYKTPDTEERILQDTVNVVTSPSISSPVICLELGQTIMFGVSAPDHYPVYRQDALINSNLSFDYSGFELLESLIKNDESITLFPYTFSEPGVYLFEDNADSDQQIVIGVMDMFMNCPFNGQNIQPRTAASMHLIGTKQETDLVLEVDWVVIGTLFGLLLLLILLFTALFYFYSQLTWYLPPITVIEYREKQMKLKIKGDKGKRTNMQYFIQGMPVQEDYVIRQIRRLAIENGSGLDFEPEVQSQIAQQQDNVDELLQKIQRQIIDNNERIDDMIQNAQKDAYAKISALQEESEKLKGPIADLLESIDKLGFHDQSFNYDMTEDEEKKTFGTSSMAGDLSYQLGFSDLGTNSFLDETDKQQILDELQENMRKLDANMANDKSQQDKALQDRLNARKAKRRELELRKKQLNLKINENKELRIQELGYISKEYIVREQELDKEIEEQNRMGIVEILGQPAQQLYSQTIQNINQNPEQKDELIAELDKQLQNMQENITINQMKARDDLKQRLQQRKNKRKQQLKQEQVEDEKQINDKYDQNESNLNKSLDELKVLEVIAQADENAMEQINNNQNNDENQRLNQLEKLHQEELLELEKEIQAEDDNEVIQRQVSLTNTDTAFQKQTLIEQQNQLEQAMNGAMDHEKKRLMTQIQQNQQRLQEVMERENNQQREHLNSRITAKREQRRRRIEELKKKQEKEKNDLQKQMQQQKEQQQIQNTEFVLQQIVNSLDTPEMKDKAVQQYLSEKHDRELAELKHNLRHKLRICQKEAIQLNIKDKVRDLEQIRHNFKERLQSVMSSADEENILREQQNQISKLDLFYRQKLQQDQEEAWKKQQKENEKELLSLIDKQIQEMGQYLNRFNVSDQKNIIENLVKYKDDIKDDTDSKLQQLEEKKKQLDEEKRKKQEELEKLIAKEQKEKMRQQQIEIIRKQRKEEQARKEKEIRQQQLKGEITQEQAERMISNYKKQLDNMDRTLQRERERQLALLNHKLAEKRNKLNEFKQHQAHQYEEQMRIQQELASLPSLKNKQAAGYLNKWRRYPKRKLDDIVGNVKNSRKKQNVQPVEMRPSQYTHKEGDSILQQLLEKVERIEKIAIEIDTKRFEQISNMLREVDSKVRGQ